MAKHDCRRSCEVAARQASSMMLRGYRRVWPSSRIGTARHCPKGVTIIAMVIPSARLHGHFHRCIRRRTGAMVLRTSRHIATVAAARSCVVLDLRVGSLGES